MSIDMGIALALQGLPDGLNCRRAMRQLKCAFYDACIRHWTSLERQYLKRRQLLVERRCQPHSTDRMHLQKARRNVGERRAFHRLAKYAAGAGAPLNPFSDIVAKAG